MSTAASKEAYAAVVDHLPKKRGIVFDFIFRCGRYGATINEAMHDLQWPYNTTSARIHELAQDGLIRHRVEFRVSPDVRDVASDGITITREGQTVWVATAPDEVATQRTRMEAARPFETNVEGWESHPADGFGPEQPIYVTVKIPRWRWEKMKTPVRVRFL
jgi:hypothetical protein